MGFGALNAMTRPYAVRGLACLPVSVITGDHPRELDEPAFLSNAPLNDLMARLGAVNLRWTLVHPIDEYARHLGHADVLREAIDGRTGY